MTTDDVLDMVRVDDALMSPDGEWVLFSKSELDWDENERKTTWWRVPSDGSEEPYRFIGEEGGSDPAFSPDGRWLSFRRGVDDVQQLFVMRTDGGEALQLSEHATAVGSYEWTADGSAIVFVAEDELPDEEEEAREKGYVETLSGRRRYIPEVRSRNPGVRGFGERTATNSPIQGRPRT